jgi:hypothetical protein
MKTLFYLHWHEQELIERIEPLKDLGLNIQAHWSTYETPMWVEGLPDIFVISLDRLPSHGKKYAEWLLKAKKRQHIPLIFVDGQSDKVELLQQNFPKAIFCKSDALRTIIGLIIHGNDKR